jgi:hypothetical protein
LLKVALDTINKKNYRYNPALILSVQVIQRRYNGKVIFSEAGKSMKMALVALTKSFGWVRIIVTIYSYQERHERYVFST